MSQPGGSKDGGGLTLLQLAAIIFVAAALIALSATALLLGADALIALAIIIVAGFVAVTWLLNL